MMFHTADTWADAPRKRIMLFGMSGLGKSYISNILRASTNWYHYSVDYRIGTHYMGEHIVDLCKTEAMKNPLLADLLRSNSIFIGSNITFDNLSPLSTYLGKPGDPSKGGIRFEEYLRRQRLHRDAETGSMLDTAHFIERSERIYGYQNFVCDTSGSLVEVVDPTDPNDPIMSTLADVILPVWIQGSDAHTDELAKRFDLAPKPMYYQEPFLVGLWDQYCRVNAVAEDQVDPDDFVRWGYLQLLEHRIPRYKAIADRWGITIQATDLETVRSVDDFETVIQNALNAHAH
ncbi:MAG: ATPase [Pseudomonadota bacterium]